MNNLISLKNTEHINILNKINDFNDPQRIYIPINFLEKNIKIKEYVYKNTYFKNYVSSVSGSVSGVEQLIFNKINSDCVVIDNDYKENINSRNKKIKINSKKELLELLEKYKLDSILRKILNLKNIDNLVICSIDEEYYSVKEFIILVNNYREILDTIDLLKKIFLVNDALIVTKNTDFNSIKNVKSIIGTYPDIKITLAPDKYLIGHKEFLCKYLNVLEDDTLILKTSDIWKIYSILNGKDINSTIITISGNAIEKCLIINTKLGVSLKELLKKFVNITSLDYEIYINGFMQGYKINKNDDLVINDNIDYIVINKIVFKETLECINCGACNKICPYNINIKKCYENKLFSKKCNGCGLCNYICPANINLKEIVMSD